MLQYTEGYLRVKNIKIHYYRTGGEKPPFILLHGATDNGLCWSPIAEILVAKYDVIMPDAQGHGLSDRLDKNFTFRSHAGQIVGLIEQLKIDKPIIMGHSMGAGTTAVIAVEHPEIPRAIVLEDPGWMPSRQGQDSAEAEKQREGFRQYLAGLSKKTIDELIAECHRDNPLWSEAEIKPWAESKHQFDPALFSMMALDPRSYQELVPLIKCPALLIISETGLVSRAVAEDAAKLWKSKQPFRWVYLKGAGHNIRREQFQGFQDALFSFLKEIKA